MARPECAHDIPALHRVHHCLRVEKQEAFVSARQRDRQFEAVIHRREMAAEDFLERHPRWAGCDLCQRDFQADGGDPCPHCGKPLRGYGMADLLSLASEYV
jgi:hypothetical protein